MLRRLSICLLVPAIALAPLPLNAQEGSAEDLGVMSINLRNVVKPRVGFQGALQGAGTPNQAGIGGFLPLKVNDNSVWFLDALANVNFADRDNYSSIINTTVVGTTISTSSRLGYRWLNSDRSWMYGINAGYDTRPMATGYADTGVPLFGTEKTVFFQQAAINVEAISERWHLNAYGLIPIGEEDQTLNWYYKAGALQTYGIDAGYSIAPSLVASFGGYYQNGDLDDDGNPEVDNIGIRGRLAYEISNGLIAGVNISYDKAFDARVSADLQAQLGRATAKPKQERTGGYSVIKSLSASPNHRTVRVHDATVIDVEELQKFFMELVDAANLLALNAAIEAARAGTAGKGFAASAEEIRTFSVELYNSLKKDMSAREWEELLYDSSSKANVLALNAAIEAARAGTAGKGKGYAVIAEEMRALSARLSDFSF